MAALCKFEREQKYVSYDSGVTWSPLQEYKKGDLIEYESPDCGGSPIYRWVLVDGYYVCIDNDKYTAYIYQVSYDNGLYWYNVYPTQYQAGELVEEDSEFCDNAYEGHYTGETPGQYPILDPIWIVKCQESGTVLTYNDIYKQNSTNECVTSCTISNCVIGIGDGAFSGQCLTSITIPNSVMFIGDKAFYRNYDLEEVYLNDSLQTLGSSAFTDCTSIRTINIPLGISELKPCTFSGCSSLTNILIPSNINSIEESIFKGCTSLSNAVIWSKNIGTRAFINLGNLYSVTLNETEIIGDVAFGNCYSLKSINFPNSLTSIGTRAFENCSGLTSVVIPNSVTSIGANAYNTCTSLSYLTLGYGITSIENGVFANCTSLPYVAIPSTVTNIGNHSFSGCTSLTRVVIPNSVTNISERAFENCAISSITIPNSVTSIGDYAFNNCSGLTNAVIGAKNIGAYSFANCSNLSSVTLNNTEIVYELVFDECPLLTSIVFPSTVEIIYGKPFFHEWEATLYPETPPYVESGTFSYATRINVPCSSFGAYYESSQFSTWKNKLYPIGECGNNGRWGEAEDVCINGELFEREVFEYYKDGQWKTTDIYRIVGSSIGSCTFKASIYTVQGEYASIECNDNTTLRNSDISSYDIRAIEIGSCVEHIARETFYKSNGNGDVNMESVTLPNTLISIGDRAFSTCYALSALTIPNSVTTIGLNAFNVCRSMTNIQLSSNITSIPSGMCFGCRSLSSIEIPSGVTSIGKEAFRNCSGLTSITIPSGVTSIGDNTFGGCLNLSSITIPSGVISIGASAFDGCSGLTSITIEAVTPPTIGSFVFYNTNDCPIYVPSGSVETYKSASGWSTYASRIQAIP